MNQVTLFGRVGGDPELIKEGLCKFSLATSKKWTDKQGQKQEDTQWHKLVFWGNSAGVIMQYVKKGDQFLVESGEIRYSKSEKDGITKYFTEITVQKFSFVSSGSNGAAQEKQVAHPVGEELPF